MRPSRDEEYLLPADIVTQAHLQTEAAGWGPQTIVMTASFQGGSIQLAAYKLTENGLEWGRAQPANVETKDFPGWETNMAERAQLLLSDRIRDLGLYLRITGGIGRLWERSLILLRSILLVLVILRRSLHHSIGRIILERLILMKGRLLQIEKMLSIRLGWFHTCLSLALV